MASSRTEDGIQDTVDYTLAYEDNLDWSAPGDFELRHISRVLTYPSMQNGKTLWKNTYGVS